MNNNQRRFTTIEDQFRAKAASHRAAAAAPVEKKFAKLLQLQRITSEMARASGRPAKKPWQIKIKS